MSTPFDRMLLAAFEKPVSKDINILQTALDTTIRELLLRLGLVRTSLTEPAGAPKSGFIGDGLRVVPTSPLGLSVQLTPGLGVHDDGSFTESNIDGKTSANDLHRTKPLILTTAQQFVVPAAPVAPNTRIDLIEARYDALAGGSETRKIFDSGLGVYSDTAVNKLLSWALDGRVDTVASPTESTEPLSYKTGVAANPGTKPATSTGYVPIAYVHVGSAPITTIEQGDIEDARELWLPGGGGELAFGEVELDIGGGTAVMTKLWTHPGVQVGALFSINGSLSVRGVRLYMTLPPNITDVVISAQVQHHAAASSTFSASPRVVSIQQYALGSGVKADLAALDPPVYAPTGVRQVQCLLVPSEESGGSFVQAGMVDPIQIGFSIRVKPTT